MNTNLRKLRWLFTRRRREAELAEEIAFHLGEETEERGYHAARRELGNIGLVKEDTRATWGWLWIEQFFQDLRYAARTMLKNRAFTALAVLSLALGIGANTAIYSFMDSILLRALPVQNPESLVMLKWHAKQQMHWGTFVLHSIDGGTYDDGAGTTAGIFPYPAFETFQTNGSPFSALFAYHRTRGLNIAVKGQAYLASGEYVSGDFFRGLGVPPANGRLLLSEDDRFGATPVAVVSAAFSQKSFGGPEYATGQKILINNAPFTVVGVTPPGFFGVDPGMNPDVFLPLHSNVVVEAASQYGDGTAGYLDKNFYWLDVMGRLKPGVTRQKAQAVIAPVFANWVATTATDAERPNLPALMIEPGATGLETLRRKYSKPLYVLMTLVAMILAIACANVANLLLARAASRRREIGLRLSVGAGRFRVVRQLLTESVLLSLIGGMLGVVFALWGMRFLTLLLANGNENFTLRAELNWHVLLLALALSMFTGFVFGLAPALQATRVDLITAMKETRAGEPAERHSIWRFTLSHTLIVGQVALSLLMLDAAGLFVRTLSNLQSIEAGFNPENLLVFDLNARQAGRPSAEIADLYDGLLKRFKAMPGVRGASLSNHSFINAGFGLNHRIPGKPPNPDDRMLIVGPSYLKTMQIPIVAGREINERDTPRSRAVAMISERFAKVNFPGENPIGKQVILVGQRRHESETGRQMEIIGVVKDAKYGGLTEKIPPVLYIPYNQGWPQPEAVVFLLRTGPDPLAYVHTIREIVRQADSRIPVSDVKTETAEIDQTMNQQIVFARLCSGFALLALVIACVGLYGTVSYNVVRRTAEIGIRMALGAQRGRLLWMILRQAGVLTVVGLAIGVPGALAASKLVKSFLFGMQPNDPVAIGGAAATLLACAILASYAPAYKASRIDPLVALRHE